MSEVRARTDLAIRRARREDVPDVARIVNDWIDETNWFPRVYSRDQIEGLVSDNLDKRVIWVAGEPVAAYLSMDPVEGKIIGLYCDEPGRGAGKALLDVAREGRDFVWLTAHEPNVRAQKFYRREGFVEAARIDPEPPETVREIRMEWRR